MLEDRLKERAIKSLERRKAEQAENVLEGRRRLALKEDYIWVKKLRAFWDLQDCTLYEKESVNASIPKAEWKLLDDGAASSDDDGSDEGDTATPRRRGRGRPKRKLELPSETISRIENDQTVENITYMPGAPRIVLDMHQTEHGLIPQPGARLLNTYRPPPSYDKGIADLATPWIDHVKKLWPDPLEHEYFFDYMAHLIQRPSEKCNAAVVLSGTQGIGKDASLHPIKAIVGKGNEAGIDPDMLFSKFKPWIRTLLLVIDEVRASSDEMRASHMYNLLKPYIAAPPTDLPMEIKYKDTVYIPNIMRVVITTNNKLSLYIPKDDRRIFMMHSLLSPGWHQREMKPEYFNQLFEWFEKENQAGIAHVAAWLKARDLAARRFNPKADPPKTMGWRLVANSWDADDDAFSRAYDLLSRQERRRLLDEENERRAQAGIEERLGVADFELPDDFMDVFFSTELLADSIRANDSFDFKPELAGLLRKLRKFNHRAEQAGYVVWLSPTAKRWGFNRSVTEEGKPRVVGKFESTYALVRESAVLQYGREGVERKIRERGSMLATFDMLGKQPNATDEAEDDRLPANVTRPKFR